MAAIFSSSHSSRISCQYLQAGELILISAADPWVVGINPHLKGKPKTGATINPPEAPTLLPSLLRGIRRAECGDRNT